MTKSSPSHAIMTEVLSEWFQSNLGRALILQELVLINTLMADSWGRDFIQLGQWGSASDWQAQVNLHRNTLLATWPCAEPCVHVDSHCLPLRSRSVNTVVLPHTLEHVSGPHRVLRESARVLTDHGRMIVLGFNPYSAMALRRHLPGAAAAPPLALQLFSERRIRDWLHLLDFEILEVAHLSIGFPWNRPQMRRLPFDAQRFLQPVSEIYFILAKKQVIPLSLVGRNPAAALRMLTPAPLVL